MAVSRGDAAFAQLVQHGGVVDPEVVADSREGPAEVVEVDGVVDLLGREAAAAHLHAVPMEDVADRSPFDAEPVAEFVHRRAGSVVGDQLLDLLGVELPGAAGEVPLDRRRLGCIEAGKLLTKLFQGSDLVFCVRVRSPSLHTSEASARGERSPFCVSPLYWGAEPPMPPTVRLVADPAWGRPALGRFSGGRFRVAGFWVAGFWVAVFGLAGFGPVAACRRP